MDRYFSKRCYIGNELRAARRTTAFGVVVAFLGIVIVGSFAFGAPPSPAADTTATQPTAEGREAPPTQFEIGRRLFEHVWQPGSSPDDDQDGLGPVFNERSCVACHNQGGVGGSARNYKNVELISVVVPEGSYSIDGCVSPSDRNLKAQGINALRQRADLHHVELGSSSTTVLHLFGTDPSYARFREQLLNLPAERLTAKRALPEVPQLRRLDESKPTHKLEKKNLTLMLSRRNSTAMFGAGLIDRIDPKVIKAVAHRQPLEDDQVSGRAVGRFGWRAQTGNLSTFVKGACAVELGLSVHDTPESTQPFGSRQINPPRIVGQAVKPPEPVFDLSERQVEDLTHFVAHLPAPKQRLPADAQLAAEVKIGEAVFSATGCAVCHRPNLGIAEGIYSDLLVHDMGPDLEDLQPAPQFVSTDYYKEDTFRSYPGNRYREWRTPPLWGVADSAPYLHDGRAPNLDTAITMHGGEAKRSVEKYRALSDEDRSRLLAFLGTLAAPEPLPPLEPEPKKKVAARSP